jgi:hypothetical protein
MKAVGRWLLGAATLLVCVLIWFVWEWNTGGSLIYGIASSAIRTPSPVASAVKALPRQYTLACSSAQTAQNTDAAGNELGRSGDAAAARVRFKVAYELWKKCATTTTQPWFKELFEMSAVWDDLRMTDRDDAVAYQAAMSDARSVTQTIAAQTKFPEIRTIANQQLGVLDEMP